MCFFRISAVHLLKLRHRQNSKPVWHHWKADRGHSHRVRQHMQKHHGLEWRCLVIARRLKVCHVPCYAKTRANRSRRAGRVLWQRLPSLQPKHPMVGHMWVGSQAILSGSRHSWSCLCAGSQPQTRSVKLRAYAQRRFIDVRPCRLCMKSTHPNYAPSCYTWARSTSRTRIFHTQIACAASLRHTSRSSMRNCLRSSRYAALSSALSLWLIR
jgi:hypothetical protein